MISIPLAAECGESHEGARACYDSVPDRHVPAANTGVALQLCEDRGYAGVRWPIRATVRPIDPARRLTALPANSEALIHQGKTHLHRVVMPFSTVSFCTKNKPTPRSATYRAVVRGLRRQLGVAQPQKTALELEQLRTVLAPIAADPRGRRDRALLLVGWAAALRRSEHCASTTCASSPKGSC